MSRRHHTIRYPRHRLKQPRTAHHFVHLDAFAQELFRDAEAES